MIDPAKVPALEEAILRDVGARVDVAAAHPCPSCGTTIADCEIYPVEVDPPRNHTPERCRDVLVATLNAPELRDFSAGVMKEAAHQRIRWGTEHDAGKEPGDWFWLLGYLANKALASHLRGDVDKALHHTITAAAVLANWHAAILGKTNMRPGIDGEAALAPAKESPTDAR